jgi:hypothetical protein
MAEHGFLSWLTARDQLLTNSVARRPPGMQTVVDDAAVLEGLRAVSSGEKTFTEVADQLLSPTRCERPFKLASPRGSPPLRNPRRVSSASVPKPAGSL